MTISISNWGIVLHLKALVKGADDLLTKFLNWGYDLAFTPKCWRICLVVGSAGMVAGATGYIYWLLRVQLVWMCLPSIWLFIFSALLLLLRWSWKSDTQHKEEFQREIEARQQA